MIYGAMVLLGKGFRDVIGIRKTKIDYWFGHFGGVSILQRNFEI